MNWTAPLLVALLFLAIAPGGASDRAVLDSKIKAAPLEKFIHIPPENWSNPCITIYDNAVIVSWKKLEKQREKHQEKLQPEEVESFLVRLPLSAWSYGRIVALTECGPTSGTKESLHYRKQSRDAIIGAMKRLGVTVNPVPSA